MILEANATNDESPDYSINGGPDTRDKVFCLSINEARIYFESMKERICYPTSRAKENGAWANTIGVCDWWLRSPGSDADRAVVVDGDGYVFLVGEGIAGSFDAEDRLVPIQTAVRPALWIIT